MTYKHQELINIFGKKIANDLYRYNGISTVWELRDYCVKYPYETMHKYKAICWKRIGSKAYEAIEEYFKRIGMSSII